jgi:hypothetical protein
MVGVLQLVPWAAIPPIILANGVPESIVSAVLVVAVVSIWNQIGKKGEKSGSDF